MSKSRARRISLDLSCSYFCGFMRGMKQGNHIEFEEQLVIHHYASVNLIYQPDL